MSKSANTFFVYLFAVPCLLMFLLTVGPGCASELREPPFEDYPEEISTGKPAPVDLGSHPKARTFRTRLRAGAKEGPTFAGHYTLVQWGCGTGCMSFAFVDAFSGRVLFPPMQVYFPPLPNEHHLMERYRIAYRPDSRLMVIHGVPGEDTKLGSYYYEFTNGTLQLVQFIEWDSAWNRE
jgi:hypothetical protein